MQLSLFITRKSNNKILTRDSILQVTGTLVKGSPVYGLVYAKSLSLYIQQKEHRNWHGGEAIDEDRIRV